MRLTDGCIRKQGCQRLLSCSFDVHMHDIHLLWSAAIAAVLQHACTPVLQDLTPNSHYFSSAYLNCRKKDFSTCVATAAQHEQHPVERLLQNVMLASLPGGLYVGPLPGQTLLGSESCQRQGVLLCHTSRAHKHPLCFAPVRRREGADGRHC